jgi:hypothetical protein
MRSDAGLMVVRRFENDGDTETEATLSRCVLCMPLCVSCVETQICNLFFLTTRPILSSSVKTVS